MAEIYGGRRLTPTQVKELARPFSSKYIKDDGRGNDYVNHSIITQRLIHIFGAPPRIELLREIYDGEKLTGIVMRLTVPGGDPVEETGEADNPQSKTNGARAKDACSDAIKRCAMRLGLGLHLWAQESYFLFDKLSEGSPTEDQQQKGGEPPPATEAPSDVRAGGSSSETAKDSPEEVEGSGGDDTSGRVWGSARDDDAASKVSPEASSGDAFQTIKDAIASKRVKQGHVMAAANRVALNHDAMPEKGLSSQTLQELPDAVLEAIVNDLGLRQEALA